MSEDKDLPKDEPGALERFDAAVKTALNTPSPPRKPSPKKPRKRG